MSHIPIKWAERDDRLYITVVVSNASDVEVKFEDKKIEVSGKGVIPQSSDPQSFHSNIDLLNEIKPSESTYKVLGVSVQICAIKKEKGYWNRLVSQSLKETKSWLSVDWNLWKDEDDVENAPDTGFGGYGDMSSMLGGGAGGMDFSSMMQGAPPMGGDSDDDDDEEIDNEEEAHLDEKAENPSDEKKPADL